MADADKTEISQAISGIDHYIVIKKKCILITLRGLKCRGNKETMKNMVKGKRLV
jgi:hypothetical protein